MHNRLMIAYHSRNRELVYRLDEDLVKRGLEVWIDIRDIRPGALRRKAFYDAIVSSSHFLACLSPEFLLDDLCRSQLFWARAHGKCILPILVSEQWPGNHVERTLIELGRQHYHAIKGIEDLLYLDFSGHHDLMGATYEQNFDRLVDSVLRPPRPTPLNDRLIYFSYTWNDAQWANRLARDVQLARGSVWIDTLAVHVGAHWRNAMYEGLRHADCLVICLSPKAIHSENVMHETLLARMRGLRILPVVSDRIAKDDSVKAALMSEVSASEDMKFLNDVAWFEPVPDYQTLLTELKRQLGLEQPDHQKKSGIFLSYRRTDSQATTGRIYDSLVKQFGPDTVFKDIDNIPAGEDFATSYTKWLREKAAVMLVIIGETWTHVTHESEGMRRRRLHDVDDHVRLEVSGALQMADLKVIPVLVGNAEMPKVEELPEDLRPLAKLRGLPVRYDPDYHRDVADLVSALRS